MKLDLKTAATSLARGHLVAVPTQTFYGLAADLRHPNAVAAIFTLKQRQPTTPSPVLVPSIEAAFDLLVTPPDAVALGMMRRFWPGRLTLILPGARPDLPKYVRQADTIALRQDGHPLLMRLLHQTGHPVTGTSANLSGSPPFTQGAQVSALFDGQPPYAGHIGDDPTPGDKPSTILNLAASPPRILREGSAPTAEVMATLQSLMTS